MAVLTLSHVSKRFAHGPVLNDVSVVLNAGEKVGLVGPNGCGKTTLLRVLTGELVPDAGAVSREPGIRIGYLAQYPEAALSLTVRQALMRSPREVAEAFDAMQRWAQVLADSGLSLAEHDMALQRYAAAVDTYEMLGGYDLEHRRDAILTGLGLGEISPDLLVGELSGGQKTRLALAHLLLEEPTVLLLDEPTNYLDLPALLWLEQWVQACPHAAVIVSHDRRFLDATVSTIWALDPRTRALTVYPGNYSDYAETRQREQAKLRAAYQDQQERIAEMEEEVRALKQRARSVEQRTIHFHYRKVAKGVARRAKVQERRLERSLKSERAIERPAEEKGLYLRELTSGMIEDRRLAVAAQELRVFLDGQPVIDRATFAVHGRERVALLGANGSGKTTLLRALAGELPIEGLLRFGDGIVPGYLPQELPASRLGEGQTVLDVFRRAVPGTEAEARSKLDKFLFDRDAVHRPSYGERTKLALALLVSTGATLLLLDEPTSHLDPLAQERIEAALASYAGPMMVVSHDRAFLQAIGITRTLLIDGGRVREVGDLAAAEATLAARGHLDRSQSIL